VTNGRSAVFLDRDGTINEEVSFLRSLKDLKLIAGAASAVRLLNDQGLPICIISNQSGVARGFLTEEELVPIHQKLESELGRSGAWVDRIYYCPHHPTEGKPPYDVVCECRKPATGMLERGAQELGIDLSCSFVVGDRIVDIQAGKAVGATTILVQTGYGERAKEECLAENLSPDLIAPSIVQAVEFILEKVKSDNEPLG
jgi:D-glycero-D-manno-heptose 1,7-bisphosphate phosphatase